MTAALDPIRYEPITNPPDAQPEPDKHGRFRWTLPIRDLNWKVPDHEQARWDNNTWRDQPTSGAGERPKPMPLPDIISSLEQHAFLDEKLRVLVHDAYEINPHQVTQLTLHIARSDNLDNAGGLLNKRLRQIVISE